MENTESKKLKVAVLAGGVGSERQVSLNSGQTIFAALRAAGVEAVLSDFTPTDTAILDDASVDVFFLALHGRFGEDGGAQTILEHRNVAFTGSGAEASRLAFDKVESKRIFARAGAAVPPQVVVGPCSTEQTLRQKLETFGGRVVVKPVREGSSVGVSIVNDADQAVAAAMDCRRQFGDCMIEAFIAGREITVGIVDGTALPIIEIRSKAAFYDYHAKYIADSTEYLFDTIADASLAARIQQTAMECFNALGCRHLSRVDFILADDGTPYVLEINTLPGFTSHSLLPMAARKAGIETPDLCRQIAQASWRDHCAVKACS